MFAPKDTIFLFDLSGHPLGTVPLNSSRFRPAAPPPPDAVRDPQARMEWVSSFDLVSGVHLLKDGGYLVSYRSMTETGTRHHYVRLASDGAPQWEVRDMSRLLAVSEDDQLLMVDPDALVPNRWLIGRM